MFGKLKRKAKEKGLRFANKVLGPSPSERLTTQPSSVLISGSGAANTPLPTTLLSNPVPDPHALVPSSASPQIAPIAALQLAVAAPSGDKPPPASETNNTITPPVQDLPPHEDALTTLNMPSGAERSKWSTAWSGLKTLLDVLNASANAVGPLKSAVGGILKFIEINDVRV